MSTVNLSWLDKAVCAQVGGDLFYAEVGEDTEKAKAICRSCESRLPCLAYSLHIGDREGIFGGFSERPRRGIARQHRAGKPLEDIIAEDDALHYARLERSAELAKAAAQRNRAQRQLRERAARAALNDLEIAS